MSPLFSQCVKMWAKRKIISCFTTPPASHTHTPHPPPTHHKKSKCCVNAWRDMFENENVIYRNGCFLRLYRLTVYVYWLIDQLFNLYLSAVIWVSSHSFHFFSCSPPPLWHSLTPSPILLSLLLFLSLSVVCTVSIFALFCQGYSGQTEQFINSLCSLTVLAVSGHTFRKPY